MIKRKRKANKQAIIRGLEFYRDLGENDLIVMDKTTGYATGAIFSASAYPLSKIELQQYWVNKCLNNYVKWALVDTECTRVTK